MEKLPQSVRYVKNGSGGKWWPAAKADGGQIHLGWWFVPRALLQRADLPGIEACIREHYTKHSVATADFNAIKLVLENPSQYIWVTFEDSSLWWCTVHNGVTVNLKKENEKTEGSFWLTCDRPWSNQSVGGRPLAISNLPGIVGAVAGFRATICEPKGSRDILRVIQDGEDADISNASRARKAYTAAVEKLITRLRPKDFELLVDLILSRSGWFRRAELGGVTEGTDIEAGNAATNEIAFVQMKSRASQSVLDEYVQKYRARRDHFQRMFFVVHSPDGALKLPIDDPSIQIWTGDRIAELAVRLGLGEWIANRV